MLSTVLTATGQDLPMRRSSRTPQSIRTILQMEVCGIIQLTGQQDRAHAIIATTIQTIIQPQLEQ